MRLPGSLDHPPVSSVWPAPTWARTLAWSLAAPGDASGVALDSGVP